MVSKKKEKVLETFYVKLNFAMIVNLLTPMGDQEKIFLYNINITSIR